jgi:hypothetical protein
MRIKSLQLNFGKIVFPRLADGVGAGVKFTGGFGEVSANPNPARNWFGFATASMFTRCHNRSLKSLT